MSDDGIDYDALFASAPLGDTFVDLPDGTNVEIHKELAEPEQREPGG